MHQKQWGAVLATVLFLGALGTARADAAPSDFGCRASGVRVTTPILNAEPITSNTPRTPCATDADSLASVTIGTIVKSGLVNTDTTSGSSSAAAHAIVNGTTVSVSVANVQAAVLETSASASCNSAGQAVFAGHSKVVGLTINGAPINVLDDTPVTIPVLGLVTVAINERTVTATSITERALHITAPLLGIDVAIAESIADAKACAPAKPQCSDGIDNADPEDTLADAADPGCHTDLNPGNPGSYDPNDNDETNKPQCSDGIDNADPEDTLADAADPGCHTDGNPGNPGSYDPNDNDETNLPTSKTYVGYADNWSGPGVFPNPWEGSPNSLFVGHAEKSTGGYCTQDDCYDAGAIRIDNTSAVTEAVMVTVDLGTHHYALWGTQNVPAGARLILTQTSFDGSYNFDTSETATSDCAHPDSTKAVVHVTINGTTTNLTDASQVLNTGGIELDECGSNESHAWTALN